MSLFIFSEPETVTSDYRVVMNDDAFADDRVLANGNARMNLALIADANIVVNRRVRMNAHAISDTGVLADDRVRPDKAFRADCRGLDQSPLIRESLIQLRAGDGRQSTRG